MDDLAQKAEIFATSKHSGQKRKFDGSDYVTHPIRVAEIVKNFKTSKNIDSLVAAALLHDTLEDTQTDESELYSHFGTLVTSLVRELTSDKTVDDKSRYLANKMISMSSYGLVIKLADRLDNVSDFAIASEKFVTNYTTQTNYILNELEASRKLSITHKRLIAAIRNKMAA